MKKSRYFFSFLVSLGMISLTTSIASAASFSLTRTLGDFKRGDREGRYPDFETSIAEDIGIVKSQLGKEGKPVYASSITARTTTGKANFQQWYRDIPGVNMSAPLTLLFTEKLPGSGIYSYDNPFFFPIDHRLFGNEDLPRNYHFTFELSGRFTYRSGQFFTIGGDDDIWVFINRKMVIDRGGVSPVRTTTIDLDTLRLALEKTHDLKVFFAERHTGESMFRIDTSIVFQEEFPLAPESPITTSEPSIIAGLLTLGFLGLDRVRSRRKTV